MSNNLWNNPVSGNNARQEMSATTQSESRPGIPPGYADYTGTATRFEDTDIYRKAVNVSDARPADNQMSTQPPSFQETVIRRAEVPYTRTVKVPVKTTKLVPDTVVTMVPVKKLVQVPSFTVVDEEYTVFEEREAVREKEIWVKKIVPEKYIEKVPVKKIRQVQRPTMETREVEDLVSVEVPTNRAVEVDGYRVDEVQDTKLVEVEELQTYNWRKEPTDERLLAKTREVGRVPGQHFARNVGRDILDTNDRALNEIDLDSTPDNAMPSQRPSRAPAAQFQVNNTNSFYRKSGGNMGIPQNLPGDAQVAFSNDNFTDGRFIRAAGGEPKGPNGMQPNSSGSIGLSVKNTHTRHTDGTGVLVTKVERGGPAARCGLQESDIISSVNNIPTTTVEEFAAVLRQVPGPLALTVNRDGRRNINLNLIR